MPRQVPFMMVAGYSGRRSHQALRSDANLSAATLQKMASASQKAGNTVVAQIDRIGGKFVRLAQISAFIFGVGMVRDFFVTGLGFEKAMSGVQAVSDSTRVEFRKLQEQAKELGATTVFTAVQSAQAMEKLALAGLQVNEIFDIMPAVLNLAAAGELDMAESASIAVGTLKGFALETEQLANAIDIMAFTASNSNQTIRDLGVAFSFVGPVASAAGIRFTEVNAALAILANRNLKAERGGTALRRIISILIGDLDAGEKGLAGFGLELVDSAGRSLGLADSIDAINAAGTKLTDIMDEFKQRAGPAFISLMQAGGDAVRGFETRLKLVGGTAQEIADIRLNNLQGRITLMTSAWRNLANELFENALPVLNQMTIALTGLLRSMAADTASVTRLANTIGKVVRIFGELFLLLIAFKGIRFVGGIIGGFRKLNFSVVSYSKGVQRASFITRSFMKRLGGLGALGVVGFGILTFQIASAWFEINGLNDAMQEFFTTLLTSRSDMDHFVESMRGSLTIYELMRRKFEQPIGVFNEEDGSADAVFRKIDNLITKYDQAVKAGSTSLAKWYFQQLIDMEHITDRTIGSIITLDKQIQILMEEQPEIWKAARAETENLIDTFELAVVKLDEYNKKSADDLERRIEAEKLLAALQEDAQKFLDKATKKGGFFSPEQLNAEIVAFELFRDKLGEDMVRISAFADGARERILAFVDTLKNMGTSVPDLEPFINLLLSMIDKIDGVESHTENLKDAWKDLSDAAQDVGEVTVTELQKFAEKFDDWLEAAEQHGQGVGFVLDLMNEKILEMINAADEAGLSIPENLALVEEAVRELFLIGEYSELFKDELALMQEHLSEFGEEWKRKWIHYGRSITKTVGDVTSDLITGQKKFSEVNDETLRKLAATAISMLVQWGIQRLIFSNITKGAIISEHAATLAGNMANVYAASYASFAAIPIIGWVPGSAAAAAAASVVAASAGASAAGATGAALAAALLGFAAGGIAFQATPGIFGESGPEALIPLSGSRAKRAFEDLGISDPSGKGSTIINVYQTFTGDNWRTDGLDEELVETIGIALEDAVKTGQITDFTQRTI